MGEETQKKITVKVSKQEAKALTSVLCDVLNYYETLPNRSEEMKLLVLATDLNGKITKAIFPDFNYR